MWLHAILAAVFWLVLFMLLKNKNQAKLPSADGHPNQVLGTLKTLQMALSFIIGTKPNYERLENWSKAYGGLAILKVPTRSPMVNIADLNIAKQIMSSSEWTGRLPDDHYLYSSHFNKPLGLLFGNGNWWKECRKLSIKLLHQLDFFRLDNMERLMALEMNHFKTSLDGKLEKSNGEVTIRMPNMFGVHTLNIVCQVIMSKRFEQDDPIAKELLRVISDFNREFNLGTSILDVFPWLRKIPGLTFMDSYNKASQVCYEYFKREVIIKRRQSGTYRSEPSDYADYFLLEIDKRRGEDPCYITDESFLVCMRDMVFAGADTTNGAIENGIVQVSLRPEIQKKVQAEIDSVIGHDRLCSYQDRLKMPYTQAVLLEALRDTSPAPLTARAPLENNQISGNNIPKGSLCGINIYAIHRSPDIWEDPEEFRPERFLSEQGEIVNADKIMPFGHGKRLCVGESVARLTIFIFFVTLMQKYTFEISDKHPPPVFKNQFGLSRGPLPYFLKVRSRS